MKQFILVFLLFSVQVSFACSCFIGDTTYSKKTLKQYDYIVRGTVEGVDTIEIRGSYDSLTEAGWDSLPSVRGHYEIVYIVYQLKYKIKITSYFKKSKKIKDDYIYVTTGTGGGDCGYTFDVGKEYIIYGYKDKGSDKQFTTNICTHTTSNITTELPKLSKVYKEKFIKPKE